MSIFFTFLIERDKDGIFFSVVYEMGTHLLGLINKCELVMLMLS